MKALVKSLDGFLTLLGPSTSHGPGVVTAEQARIHAESEFEKYRIIQDRLYESDFDRFEELRKEAEVLDEGDAGPIE